MFCTNCGKDNPDSNKFCLQCGQPMAGGAAGQPSATREKGARAVPRRLLGCGAALVGVLLLFGAALLITYFALGLHRQSDIAELVPEDAPAVVVIRPSLLQLNELRDTDRLIGSAATLAPLVAAPGVLDFVFIVYADYGEVLQDLDIDPMEDLLPWIGREVALAATDPGTDTVVVVAAVRNEARAREFLADLYEHLEDEDFELDESEHRGVTITEIVGPQFRMPLAFAVADGRLLLASDRDALEDALDRANSDRNTLESNEAFRDAMAAQPGNRLGAIYISPEMFSDDIEALDALRWIGGTVALDGNGVRATYRLGFDRDQLDRDQLEWLERDGVDNRLAARIPDDTLFYMAGSSLAGALENGATQWSDLEYALDDLRSDRDLRGLYSLLEMMTGEFALALTADREGFLAEASSEPFGLIIASEVEDGSDALAELDDIFSDLARETDSRFRTDDVGDAEIGYLENEFISGGGFLGYGITGDEMLLATSDSLVEDAFSARNRLADDLRFQATLDALPGGGLLYFYLDLDSRELAELVDLMGEPEMLEMFEEIETFGLAVEPMSRNGEMNIELFFLTERPRR